MRVAQWPFEAFKESLQRAKALAMCQEYLNRLLEEGSEEFITQWKNELGQVLADFIGFDLVDLVEGAAVRAIKETDLASRVSVPKKAKARKLIVSIRRLVEPFIQVSFLQGQSLLELAVVHGVAAYEAYILDTAETILLLNPRCIDRFSKELNQRDFRYADLK